MMKHIAILIGSYFPNYSAVGICAYNIISELKKEACISVICLKTSTNDEKYLHFEGCNLYRISTRIGSMYLKYKEKIKETKGIKKFNYRLILNMIRLVKYLKAIFYYVNINMEMVDEYEKKLNEIEKLNHLDIIICFSFPFETCIAGRNFILTFNNVKLVFALFDNFSLNLSLHRTRINAKIKEKKHKKIEWEVYNASDMVLYTSQLRTGIYQYITLLKEKFFLIEHPLLEKIEYSDLVKYEKETINIVFTGSLNKNVRNPKCAINTLSKCIDKCGNIKIHFYTHNDIHDLKVFSKKFPNQVYNYGFVTIDIAHSAMTNSDILLSIGNNDIRQIPSKIFEYMSALKPIIHFAKHVDDPVNAILTKYGNSVIIYEKNITSFNLEIIKKFIFKDHKGNINFYELASIFPEAIPANVAKIINTIY